MKPQMLWTMLLVSVLALVLSTSGSAQDKKQKKLDATTRSVQGEVMDQAEAPVNAAVVQIKDTKTLQVRSFITKEDGTYHFFGLSTNVDYELKADAKGATSGTKTLTVFDDRKTAVVNLKLGK